MPFFQTSAPQRPFTRRLLVVSGNFPPSRAVGGLRWQKMAHFAAERGWGTDVICLDPSSMPEQDPERLNDLPPGLRIYGVRHEGAIAEGVQPKLAELAKRVRGAVLRRAAAPAAAGALSTGAASSATASVARNGGHAFRPWSPRDLVRALASVQYVGGELRWARTVDAVGRRVLGPEHRAVVSSGPPHFAHVAAHRLAREARLPHVADFRDPWSGAERVPAWLANPVYSALVAQYERRVIDDAALVVANTELAARALREAYPTHTDRVVTVMNGSDDDPAPRVPRDPRFLVAYAGAIYFDRDPRLLFRAASRVIAEFGLSPDRFGMEFMGPVDVLSLPVMELARQEGVEPFVRYHPPGSRSASARLLASASLLVSLPQDTVSAIPSKIFEYATYEAWLLALAEAGSASALVLEGSGADVVAPSDVDGIAAVLRRHYQEWASGVTPRAVGGDGRFSRARQAGILLDHLDRLTAGG